MRIHRTTPTRAFSVFSTALLRDRSISWCAVGVLTYLLSLPNEARVTIRTLADQRKEGRSRIAAALHELEDSRYLRRVVHKNPESGQLFTVYEVFDTPYEDEPPAGEEEKVENLASGESALAPLAEEWWDRGATSVQVRGALTGGLPGASGYREAAQRGGALARALLQGRAVLA